MAMDYLASLTSIFGSSAVITGTGTEAVLSFKPSETGTSGNFNNPETARPEAILLAILQKAHEAQGITLARAFESTKAAVLSTKDGSQVSGEQYTIRIFSASALSGIDPDAL